MIKSSLTVKVQVKVKIALQEVKKAQRGNINVVLLFFNLGASWEWVVNATPRPLYPQQRNSVPVVWQTGWAPGPVRTDAGNLASTEIRSPYLPTRT